MSRLTLDEAIKHCLEVAEEEEYSAYVFFKAEAKKLLKAAVEDCKVMLPYTYSCNGCALNKDSAYECSNSTLHCDAKCKWRYEDEVLKLIES